MAVTTTKDAIILKGAGNSSIRLDYNVLRRSVLILRAVNHDLRQKMIKLLEDEGRMTVTEIYVKLRLEQSVASQHLALLRRAGIVITEREGKYIYYSLDKERIAEIARLLEELIK
jgi:ArsR family transcriptional regulator, virulence genes transcriptional regulator